MAWVGAVGVAVIGSVVGATAWATDVNHKITVSANALERIAREIESRPTANEINLQWRTLGKLNPSISLPPLLPTPND